MKLHYTKYKENYKRFILSTIETDINDKPIIKYNDKVNYLFNRFYNEYGFMIALDLPFYYDDIVDLAVKMGSINPNPSDALKNKVEQNYWDFMANIILEIEKDILNQQLKGE